MIIGKIWDSEYPWDVRVEKVGAALAGAGHAVHLICRNRKRQPLEERVGDITVHRMPPLPGPLAAFEGALSFPGFMNPRWLDHTESTFRRVGADLILGRDLPLAPLALSVGARLGVPVVLDIAEHYPGLLRDLYNRHDFKVQNLVLRNPIFADLLERWALPRADEVVVVVEESAERLVGLGVARERISVVCNTPTPARIESMAAVARTPAEHTGAVRLVYLGIVERSRGLGVALQALARLRERGGAARLDVFGDGTGLAAERRLADELRLGGLVTFHGRRPYEEILAQLPVYDAGIIPHHATDHWNWTIQNKLFDYMAAELPVIVSSMPPAERIVRETGAGWVFPDRDPDALATLLQSLPGPEARRAMGVAGHRAVSAQYNWTHDGRRLVEAVERARARHGHRG